MERTSYYFPEDIWNLILLRLPSKSLCRFMSVCKPWCRLITSQAFISSHLNQTLTTKTHTHILLRVNHHIHDDNHNHEEFLFYPQCQTNNGGIIKSLGVPSFVANLPRDLMHHRIVACCNGLICITNDIDVFLFNPSIHKVVKLPPFSIQLHLEHWHVFGFGVNSLTGDFKVIRVARENESYSSSPLVEVYSLKTGKWLEINGVAIDLLGYPSSSHVYLHGNSHWIGNIVGNQQCSLISFDFRDEIFGEVSMPEDCSYVGGIINIYTDRKLVTMTLGEKECIAIVLEGFGNYSIWAMKEYGISDSWTNMYNIDMQFMCRLGFVGFLENGKILMSRKPDLLTCYDPLTNLAVVLDLSIIGSGFLGAKYMETLVLHANEYMESLVLLQPRFNSIDSIY